MTTIECIVETYSGQRVIKWKSLEIRRINIPVGVTTREGARYARTVSVVATDDSFFGKLTILPYGGVHWPDTVVKRTRKTDSNYMIGEPIENGGYGVVNGDPAYVSWMPDYCNLGAMLDEPGPNDTANCILYCMEPKEYDQFFTRVE